MSKLDIVKGIVGFALFWGIIAIGCEHSLKTTDNNMRKQCIDIYQFKGKEKTPDYCAGYILEFEATNE